MRIQEITQIDDYNDDYSDGLFYTRYEDHKDSLKYLTNLASYELWGTSWPLNKSKYNRFYFKDAFGKPIGFASFRHYDGKAFTPSNIYFLKDARKQGLGFALYSFLLDRNLHIVSDSEQTQGSKALWKKLSNNYNVSVIDSVGKATPIKTDADFENAYQRGYRLFAKK